MQSQEDEVVIIEQDLEFIKEREIAIRQLEVRVSSWFLFDLIYLYFLIYLDFFLVVMKKQEMSCVICMLGFNGEFELFL